MQRPGISKKLFIWMSLAVFFFGVFYAGLYWFLGAAYLSYSLLGLSFLFTLCQILLEVSGYARAARYLFIISSVAYLSVAPFFLTEEVSHEFFLIPTVLLPLMFFSSEKKADLIIGGLIPFLGWILTSQLPHLEAIRVWKEVGVQVAIVPKINFICAYLLASMFLFYFVQYMDRFRESAISDIKNMESKLSHQRALAMHASKLASLGEVSAGVAHEINNPLAVIAAHIEVLKIGALSSDGKILKSISAMERSVERINKIVSGLRKFSGLSAKGPMKTHSLKAIVDEAALFINLKTKKHGVKVDVDVPRHLNIECDEIEIQQVIVNLVNNAIDAIANLDDKWIKIKCLDEAAFIRILIVDSGRGISKQIADKIFQPFFTTKEVGAGTGLGLSISRGIVEEHGGKLSLIESESNTTFELILPFTQTQTAP